MDNHMDPAIQGHTHEIIYYPFEYPQRKIFITSNVRADSYGNFVPAL